MGRLRIVLLFLIVCTFSASMGLGFTCKEAERNALLKFQQSLIDRSNLLGSWAGEDCCSWKGVGCNNITGNVVELDLSNVPFPPYSTNLEAREVNPALLELKYLTHLNLRGINFNGSRFPEFFGSMRQLQHLDLSFASLSGKVPSVLGNLTELVVLNLRFACSEFCQMERNSLEWVLKLENLEVLDLSGVDLSQTLDSLKILYKLPCLSYLALIDCQMGNSHLLITNSTVSSSPIHLLDLSVNLFTGPIPHFIQSMSSIRSLDLSHNHFNSPIPSWLGDKVDLEYLSLAYNNFNGPFPQFIQNLSFLTTLDLSDNQFSSSIPSWLAKKRYLEYLSLSNNHFKRIDGGIMNIIGHLCSLKYLYLSNNQLQEQVSESYVNLSRCSRFELEVLYLNNNNISSHLPIIGSLASLQLLDLSHTNLETLPPSFGGLSSLDHLSLSHNNFRVMSPFIGNLSSLRFLDLSHNSLETIHPSLGGLSFLDHLDLSYNTLSTVHQVTLSNLSSLTHLDLSSNSLILELSLDWIPPFQLESFHILPCKLNSPFPKWLLSQEKISELDLSDTGIFGPLPYNIGNEMPSLWSLRLANNAINGSIPKSLCELASLEILDMKKNRLSGIIPDCWLNSPVLGIELSSNRLSGPIPNSLTKVATLQLLSLNNNSLEGEFPLSWSNCAELMVLDVGKNTLHGEIPPWTRVNFTSLQILILRENKFKGIIPSQLCSMHTLQIIDLASNMLAGTIPRCFGHFEGMGSTQSSAELISSPPSPVANFVLAPTEAYSPTIDPGEWNAVEVIKGEEREYTTVLHLLVNMDLSCNNLVGVIPAEITSSSHLVSLNLSHNHLGGVIPKEIGKMKLLESLDLSSNNLSGSIPESISSLNYLSKMNLSFNNLQGKIPTGSQLQVLNDPSIYMGNPYLCGDPLPKKCHQQNSHAPESKVIEGEEEDDKHEKMWFYLVIMLGFATGFWGVIGVLHAKRSWRHAYFRLAEEIADWSYVRVAVWISRAKGGS